MHSRTMRLLLLASVAVAILVLSLLSKPPLDFSLFAGADKVKHWFGYTVLGFLTYISWKNPASGKLLSLLISVVSCTFYGGIIEVLQHYTGRDPDIYDMLADLAGALTGSIAALWIIEVSEHRGRGKS